MHDNINRSELGKDPEGWVQGLYSTLMQGLSDKVNRSFGPALIGPGVGPVYTDILTGTHPTGHLPTPVKHDPVQVKGPWAQVAQVG